MQPLDFNFFPPIPEDTHKTAQFIFAKNNFYITVGDRVESIFTGLAMTAQIIPNKTSLQRQAILYMVTIFQYIESLPDKLATDALKMRLDWKYALHLPLRYEGLDIHQLCEFRSWLWEDPRGQLNMSPLLLGLSAVLWQTRKEYLPQETPGVLEKVCLINQVANAWVAMCAALSALATGYPEWLSRFAQPHWYQRYSMSRMAQVMTAYSSEPVDFANAIGRDAAYLLSAVSDSHNSTLAALPEIIHLKHLWQKQDLKFGAQVSWGKDTCARCKTYVQQPDPRNSSRN